MTLPARPRTSAVRAKVDGNDDVGFLRVLHNATTTAAATTTSSGHLKQGGWGGC